MLLLLDDAWDYVCFETTSILYIVVNFYFVLPFQGDGKAISFWRALLIPVRLL